MVDFKRQKDPQAGEICICKKRPELFGQPRNFKPIYSMSFAHKTELNHEVRKVGLVGQDELGEVPNFFR